MICALKYHVAPTGIRRSTTLIRCVALFCFVVSIAPTPQTYLHAHAPNSQPDVLSEFSYQKQETHLFVPVNIDDNQYQFILDTGASACVFDTSLRSHLSAKRGEAVASFNDRRRSQTIELFTCPTAVMGRVPFGSAAVTCLDLKMANAACGRDVDGIVGMSLLRDYVLQIDPDNKRVRILDRGAFKNSEWLLAFQLEYVKGCPYIQASLNDQKEMRFLVDTGINYAGVVSGYKLVRLRNHTGLEVAGRSYTTSIRGPNKAHFVRVDSFSMGPYTHNDVILRIGETSALGLQYLCRYIALLDFPNARITTRAVGGRGSV